MTDVNLLELSVRSSNCLRHGADPPITTIEDLATTSDRHLLRIPNFGRRSLAECRYAVEDWRKKHPPDPSLDTLSHAMRQCLVTLSQALRQCADILDSLTKWPAPNGHDDA
jgi:hypothetical protein